MAEITLSASALLGALRLGSAALPIGAFAYSQGLERAVSLGHVRDSETAERWIGGLLSHCVLTLDVPFLRALYEAWRAGDEAEVGRLSDLLFAMRGSLELRDEERQLGRALLRLLSRLGVERAARFGEREHPTLAAAFALSAVSWEIPSDAAALAYCFAWAEAQVGAATRLVPLGQSAAQGVLSRVLKLAAEGVPPALTRTEATVSTTAPGQALFSAAHETEYSRLFRS
ncbi:MAG TPA: urease accessory UreF family protein [Polyangiaceae bacterium]|nr:urease accessory UreF family protein [Polyangiaceae bacterium]